ncbi:SMI1/KNR4 family protein [Pseudomonas syringae]|nr:SMI1/KNR4 family protein [Pseudomonas syringae]MBD8792125.1 SMI1/KNR4 family protein [Pseudomonas syringae]MBD8803387.1 SMI1/KNR4 family protein [Pseudomonas syringae]MBD8814504.1 SMI1/KNR4 family protein [Pseudomonas syringae]
MPPSFNDDFAALERWLGQPLAPALRTHLIQANGASCGEYVCFYAPAELLERNKTYEVQSYCPGWLTIGDDGGGRAVMVSPGLEPATVFLVDHGSMAREEFHAVADELRVWIDQDCPLPMD